jgi:hypothetical protein
VIRALAFPMTRGVGRRAVPPAVAMPLGVLAATLAFVGGISGHAHPSLLVTVVHVRRVFVVG